MLYGLRNAVLLIGRGTVPQALFGHTHDGAISGALAGPALLAKAAGPLAPAVLLQHAASPMPVVGLLLAGAVALLARYLLATSADARATAPRRMA